MTRTTRILVCAMVGTPLVYAALAFGGMDDRWLVFLGVIMFLIAYTVLDVLSHPVRPIPGEWLRRRITTNLIYLVLVGIVSLAVPRLLA